MRCGSFQLRVLRFCCLIWIGFGALQIEAQTLRTAENAQFEIVALDARSVRYVDELSRHIAKTSEAFLDRRQMDFPSRILVRLKPEQYVDFEGAYRLTLGERGFVTLDFFWGKTLSLRQCCRALSEALLLRYAFYNFGPSAAENLREWTAASLGMQAFFGLRPALQKALAEEFRQSPPPQLEELLGRKWDDLAGDESGYWFYRSLLGSDLSAGEIRELYRAAVAGADISSMLLERVQSQGAVSLKAWWAQALPVFDSSQRSVFEDMARSRQWVGDLSKFEWEKESANLKQIWMLREEPAIREMLEARLELLRIRITRVNPAYFNAARSLGLLFETMLESDESHEFLRGLSQFLGDFEDTKEIERIVEEKLASPQR